MVYLANMQPLPGPAQSYRLAAAAHQSHGAGRICALRDSPALIARLQSAASISTPFRGFPPQVSQAKKMKRGLYV